MFFYLIYIMTKEKVFTSFTQYQREMFPDNLLERLAEELISNLFLSKSGLYNISKDKNNPKIGSIEIAKQDCKLTNLEQMDKIIESFYKKEGYKTKIGDGLIRAEKHSERYLIFSSEDSTYNIYIQEDF